MGTTAKKQGRPRTPTAKLRVRGSKYAKRKGEPPTEGVPVAPSPLKGAALGYFNELAQKLTVMGISGELDAHALARYCILLNEFYNLEKTHNVHEMGKLSNILSILESKFGLTASDRAGLSISKPDKKDRYFGSAG